MTIFVNNVSVELTSQQDVTTVLQHLKLYQERGIAVAVNNHVIPRDLWNSYRVNEHDKLVIIKATQGG